MSQIKDSNAIKKHQEIRKKMVTGHFNFEENTANTIIALVGVNKILPKLINATSGQYGVCANCGSNISPERLAILKTNLCIECQLHHENNQEARL